MRLKISRKLRLETVTPRLPHRLVSVAALHCLLAQFQLRLLRYEGQSLCNPNVPHPKLTTARRRQAPAPRCAPIELHGLEALHSDLEHVEAHQDIIWCMCDKSCTSLSCAAVLQLQRIALQNDRALRKCNRS